MCNILGMEDIKEIVSQNLLKLRKHNKLTQLELAQKLNYSDKAVSRWEKGEVLPDVETLSKISQIYGINLSDIFQPNLVVEEVSSVQEDARKKIIQRNRIIVSALAEVLVWFVATILYVTFAFTLQKYIWIIFIWAIPVSSIVAIVFNALWGRRHWTFLLVSMLIWSLLISIYLQFLSYNIWLILLFGIPAQLAVILWAGLKPKKKIKSDA